MLMFLLICVHNKFICINYGVFVRCMECLVSKCDVMGCEQFFMDGEHNNVKERLSVKYTLIICKTGLPGNLLYTTTITQNWS